MEQSTARALFDLLKDEYMPNTKYPELGHITTLKKLGDARVDFSFDWDTQIVVLFRPKTIGVKIEKISKDKSSTKQISKSLDLEQSNLAEEIFNLVRSIQQ